MSCGLVIILRISARTNTGNVNGNNHGCGDGYTGYICHNCNFSLYAVTLRLHGSQYIVNKVFTIIT